MVEVAEGTMPPTQRPVIVPAVVRLHGLSSLCTLRQGYLSKGRGGRREQTGHASSSGMDGLPHGTVLISRWGTTVKSIYPLFGTVS